MQMTNNTKAEADLKSIESLMDILPLLRRAEDEELARIAADLRAEIRRERRSEQSSSGNIIPYARFQRIREQRRLEAVK